MRELLNTLVRGVVNLVNPAGAIQSLQMTLTADEVKDGLEHFEPYGYTSNPHPGAEGLTAFIGGDRSHGVVICVSDRRFRLTGLKSGEVALHTDEGDFIHFKRNRVIELQTLTLQINATDSVALQTTNFSVKASGGVTFDTPLISTTGRIESSGDQVAAGVSLVTHVHEGSDKKPVPGG